MLGTKDRAQDKMDWAMQLRFYLDKGKVKMQINKGHFYSLILNSDNVRENQDNGLVSDWFWETALGCMIKRRLFVEGVTLKSIYLKR